MNDEQKRVVKHIYGPAAVLAGAGSGKTYTLINRIQQLVKYTDAKRIVMLTFTNAAADEMKNRASKVDEKCKDVIATTYHKYCMSMLRQYGENVGIYSHCQVLDVKKYKDLIEFVKSSNETYEKLENFPSAAKLHNIFSVVANNEDISIKKMIAGTKYYMYEEEIKALYDEVHNFSLDNQKIGFDDILIYMNSLLNIDSVCKMIAESFDFLMVDEFQDTNTLQLDILLKLSRYNANIVVVGDASQSIYKFRGAKVENIQKFIDEFVACDVYKLSFNYRSTQEILDAANSIMNKYVKSWSYTNMESENKFGSRPVLKKHRNDFEQADWILSKISHSIRNGRSLNDIVVIQRKSMASIRLENELNKAKIPFEKIGGYKFIDYQCVGDVISFLQILIRKDVFSWFNVLSLIPGIGKKTATIIANSCKEKNFLDKYKKRKFGESLNELTNKLNIFSKFKKDLTTLIDLVSEYYFSLREYSITNSKKNADVKATEYEKIDRDREIISLLKDMASSYKSLQSFLEDIALDTLNTKNSDIEKLTITTIHGAKGKEWPIVILIDPIDYDSSDEEEELRCLYVAMTRAEDDLTLSIPMTKMLNGSCMYIDFTHFIYGSESYFDEVRI